MKRSLRKLLRSGETEPQGAVYQGVDDSMPDSKDFKVPRAIGTGSKSGRGGLVVSLSGSDIRTGISVMRREDARFRRCALHPGSAPHSWRACWTVLMTHLHGDCFVLSVCRLLAQLFLDEGWAAAFSRDLPKSSFFVFNRIKQLLKIRTII